MYQSGNNDLYSTEVVRDPGEEDIKEKSSEVQPSILSMIENQ